MAEFVKVALDANRMCDSFESCEHCPVKVPLKTCKLSPIFNDSLCKSEAEELEAKIEQWAESHPEKTNIDALKKVFPKAKLNDNCCLVTVFGISKDCKECMKNICGDSCRERIDTFLNAPYEELEEKDGA